MHMTSWLIDWRDWNALLWLIDCLIEQIGMHLISRLIDWLKRLDALSWLIDCLIEQIGIHFCDQLIDWLIESSSWQKDRKLPEPGSRGVDKSGQGIPLDQTRHSCLPHQPVYSNGQKRRPDDGWCCGRSCKWPPRLMNHGISSVLQKDSCRDLPGKNITENFISKENISHWPSHFLRGIHSKYLIGQVIFLEKSIQNISLAKSFS